MHRTTTNPRQDASSCERWEEGLCGETSREGSMEKVGCKLGSGGRQNTDRWKWCEWRAVRGQGKGRIKGKIPSEKECSPFGGQCGCP